MPPRRHHLLPTCLLAAALRLPAAAGVYEAVLADLSRLDNRLPGSTNSLAAMEAIEQRLRAAGLDVRRQTHDTIVPRTARCRLTVDGREVEAYPCENGVAPFLTGEPWRGAVVFAGSGRIEDLDGLDLREAMAVIDLDAFAPTVDEVFMHGARAAILVGSDATTQWNLTGVLADGPALVPRVYVPRAAAAAAGLLRDGGARQAELDVRVTLEQVETANLWSVLPGRPGATFNLDAEEVLILSAALGTYGLTPDLNPSLRRAANAALLADVMVSLAAAPEPPARTVIAVWFGSIYGNQEGARYFYHAFDQSDTALYGRALEARLVALEEEAAELEELLAAVGRDGLFTARDQAGRACTREMKMLLAARVNEANALLQELRLELRQAEKTPGADTAALRQRLAALQERKESWNALRTLILRRREPATEAERQTCRETAAAVGVRFARRLEELRREHDQVRTWMTLRDVFLDRELIGHFDFDFGDGRAPWTFSMINAAAPQGPPPQPGHFLMHLTRLRELHARVEEPGWPAPLMEGADTPFYKPFSLSTPLAQSAPTAVGAAALGIAGFQMISVGDRQPADPLPARAPVDLAPLLPRIRRVAQALAAEPECALRRVAVRRRMDPRLFYLREGRNNYRGTHFVNLARGSSEESGPAAGGMVTLLPGWANVTLCGNSLMPRAALNTRGLLALPMIEQGAVNNANLYAFWHDEEGALRRYGGGHGVLRNLRVPLFHGYGGMAFSWGYAPDPVGGALYQARTLIARTDAAHRNALALNHVRSIYHFYADKPDPVKRIGGNGDLLLNATPERPMGEGVPLDARTLLNLDGIAQGARDGWQLNESRLGALRRRNSVNDGLETLHAAAREHLDLARTASAGRRHALARAHAVAATCIANRVYGPLRGIADDLVQAVIVLLLLSIPFAFAMERLVFGFTSIYKQVLGFTGFFLGAFLLLFFTHPAFELADSPVIIFLAFVIILLSAVTLGIVMSKIRQEIRAIQGLASTVHTAGGQAPAMAAVLIGISGMRNRPLKTCLTAVTVVLLTFTIVVFASFGARYGVIETFLGRGSDEDRIELRRHSYLHLDDHLVESLRLLYGDRCLLFRRGGCFRNPVRGNPEAETDRILHCPRSGKTVGVGAFWGIERAEVERSERFRQILGALADPAAVAAATAANAAPIMLPDAIADALAVRAGDLLLYGGARFLFTGRFDAARLQSVGAIDDGHILPPDFAETLAALSIGGDSHTLQTMLEQTNVGSYEWFGGDSVAVADYGDLERQLPGLPFVNFVVLQPRSPEVDLDDIAHELAPLVHGTVQVKSREGARRLFFTRAVAGSGFGDVVVPRLLGGLIIFSSLMGSIVDRELEIFTYSALGLSPPDVGLLFFAESCVYAVIGGMGGYLLGQVTSKLVNFLGSRGLIDAPEMNVASLGSVMTILVVMAVVMLSTIIPATRAGRAASPGVARRGRMPAPRGDPLDFVFPFTVSETDFAGIVSFIREHFENHADATLGDFAARDVRLFRLPADGGGPARVGIEAEISLAPFDLGIFQRFRMYTREFDIPGIGEVVVEIERVGGSPAAWVRGNRRFADELRHQFLLWRSLPLETVELYRRRTAEEMRERNE